MLYKYDVSIEPRRKVEKYYMIMSIMSSCKLYLSVAHTATQLIDHMLYVATIISLPTAFGM